MSIRERVQDILREVNGRAEVEAAAKGRTAREIDEVIEAGIRIVGENYISDLKSVYYQVKKKAEWHFIGSVKTQKHDLLKRKFLEIIDMIETVDSFDFALELDKRCELIGKTMPVLVEVNSGRESQKSGVMPEEVLELVKKVARLGNVKVMGLMTMGPAVSQEEEIRPYFRLTKRLFDDIKRLNIPGVEMRYLSMGMSDTYRIAIEEGANIVRIGTLIFGARKRGGLR